MTTATAATTVTQTLVLRDRAGTYYRLSPAVLAANRVPDAEKASLEAALRDDTGGFFFYDYAMLAMPKAPSRGGAPGALNTEPVSPNPQLPDPSLNL